MKENLIITDKPINNEIAQEKELFKEIKKMLYIKYLNLFFSIFRFSLMFYLLSLLGYFPSHIRPTDFFISMHIFLVLILPVFTIINLFTVITGVLNRSFLIKKDVNNYLESIKYICCCLCCICSKNVGTLKLVTFIFSLISFIWSFYLLYFFIQDLKTTNNSRFFPYLEKQVTIKTILHFADSLLLLCQSYFYYYYEYFLKRGEIYIEFYKRLIIKNRNKEASFVRNELPANIDNFLIYSGTEMNNV